MGNVKHTPGPWKYRHAPLRGISDDTYCIDWSEDQEEVAEIVHGEANARLIAAAPELLEALIAAVECGMVPSSSANEGGAAKYAKQVVVADMIRSAIAKATGGA